LVGGLAVRGVRVLVDVRRQPYGRSRRYRPDTWREACRAAGIGYRSMRSLGNLNYGGGPIAIADPGAVSQLAAELRAAHHVALMCVCPTLTGCHVEEVLRLLSERVEFEHLRFGS